VHGDVSPKNILCGEHGPVFLDAECAWYGDPAFDLAFCLNHFLLKGARKGVERHDYLRAFLSFEAGYLAKVDWEDPLVLEARAAALLPCLLLARIDGKSPVEYLSTEAERNAVRRFAVPLIAQPPARVGDIAELWRLAR
jgi:Ser/Thr protein kinase RdoA (MazF antagonist)